MSAGRMAAMHEQSMSAFPATTKGAGNQILQPRLANGVKVFHLSARETRWEVAPGQFQTALAYNNGARAADQSAPR